MLSDEQVAILLTGLEPVSDSLQLTALMDAVKRIVAAFTADRQERIEREIFFTSLLNQCIGRLEILSPPFASVVKMHIVEFSHREEKP